MKQEYKAEINLKVTLESNDIGQLENLKAKLLSKLPKIVDSTNVSFMYRNSIEVIKTINIETASYE